MAMLVQMVGLAIAFDCHTALIALNHHVDAIATGRILGEHAKTTLTEPRLNLGFELRISPTSARVNLVVPRHGVCGTVLEPVSNGAFAGRHCEFARLGRQEHMDLV